MEDDAHQSSFTGSLQPDSASALPRVRFFHLPSAVYLSRLKKFKSEFFEFYSMCQGYVSEFVWVDPVNMCVCVTGRLSEGARMDSYAAMPFVRQTWTDAEGTAHFTAQFMSLVHQEQPPPSGAADDFAVLNVRWHRGEGLFISMLEKTDTASGWNMLEMLEPFEVDANLNRPSIFSSRTKSTTFAEEDTLTLAVAASMGYFDTPRRTTVADIALQLDISKNTVNRRLRRCMSIFVDNHLNRMWDISHQP